MTSAAREDYLVTDIMTAAPQKLHLMLIEAAIRQAKKAQALWSERKDAEAGETLIRCQEIVTQMMSGINPAVDPKLARQAVGVYGFIFRSLVAAHLHRDERKLADALSILEIERDTWRQLCQKLPAGSAAAADSGAIPAPHSSASFVA